MYRSFRVLLFGLIVMLMTGCATRKEIVQFQKDSFYLQQQVYALREENKAIAERLELLGKILQQLHEDNLRDRADLLTEIDALKNRSQAIDSRLADNNDRMAGLMLKVEQQRQPVWDDSTAVDSTRQDIGLSGLDSADLYNNAYLDFSKGDYQLALQGFRVFLTGFPENDYADNAQYWIAEIYYTQQDYFRAIEEFNKIILQYSEGDKVASALLKIAYCHYNMGGTERAEKYLKAVIQHYPETEEARLAESRLSADN